MIEICHCVRCGHNWATRKGRPPRVCPTCKSPYWDKPMWKFVKRLDEEAASMKVILGSNDFFGVPFPLVLADRFFHMYAEEGRWKLDVFRWDEEARQAIYEVKASKPQMDNIEANPPGIVTFSGESDGGFLFKFRPKPGVSQIFGKVPVPGEVEVKINDQSIRVNRGNTTLVTFTRNTMTGLPIGIQVGADGSIGMGVNRLPDGMQLARRSA